MPESFAALENNEWDSWISYFEDCAVIKGWSEGQKAQFLAVLMHGSAFRELQNLATDARENYATLKEALREQFVLKERVEVHKIEFRAKHGELDEKLPNLASSLRRLVSRAYLEAVRDLQDSLATDQLIDALEDREVRMKLRESGPKTTDEGPDEAPDEAFSHTLEIAVMYEAESRRNQGRSVRVVHEPSKGENSELVELLKQNTAPMNQIVNFVQKLHQQPSSEPKRNSRGLGPNAGHARGLRFRLCRMCYGNILWQIVNKHLRGRETRDDPKD